MTSATETATDQAPAEAAPQVSPLTSFTIKAHLVIAALFLLDGLGQLGLTAVQLTEPTVLGDTAFTFGRMYPMALNTLVFGWLVLGLTGVAYYVVPKAVGAPLAMPMVAFLNLGLMTLGVAGGTGMIALGWAEGSRLSAMPMAADGALALSFFLVAAVLSITARRGDRSAVPLSAWYLIASAWWLTGAFAIGAIPGRLGLPAEIQAAFSESAILGLGVVAGCIGGGYHLVSQRVPEAQFNPDLGRIGFFSLAFTWVFTVGIAFQNGPAGDWFGTVAVVFASGLLMATVAIVTDFAMALRGRWPATAGDAPLMLFTAGLVVFTLVPLHMFLLSLRSISSVVRFTRFETVLDVVGIVGAFTLWAMALTLHVLGRSGKWTGRLIVIPVILGVAVAAISHTIGGIQQGLAWVATVQSGEVAVGEAFRPAVTSLAGFDRAYASGLTLIIVGAIAFFVAVLVGAITGRLAEGGVGAPLVAKRLRSVGRNVVYLFAVVAVGAYVLPAADADHSPSLLAEQTRSFAAGSPAERGRELFVAEGCVYCHTQQVRPIVTDLGLGPVSVPGDFAYDPQGVAGQSRLGPDLTHAGSRDPSAAALWVREHLVNPRAARPWSTMPSYSYLSDDDLTAIAVYVAGLE